MEETLTRNAQLTGILLATSEDEYDTVAHDTLAALKKLPTPDGEQALKVGQDLPTSPSLIEIVPPNDRCYSSNDTLLLCSRSSRRSSFERWKSEERVTSRTFT